jgi:hypothetical protein
VKLDLGEWNHRLSGVDGGTIARRPATFLAALASLPRRCHDRLAPNESGGCAPDLLTLATTREGRDAANFRGLAADEDTLDVDDRKVEQPLVALPLRHEG